MIVNLAGVSVARAGKPVLRGIDLTIAPGERIWLTGENGAGKSSILMLLARRLHPYNNEGLRTYAWDADGTPWPLQQKQIALVGREEQIRLQAIHATSTVSALIAGHIDGADFLYREPGTEELRLVAETIERWQLTALARRKIKTLSLGEMRLVLIARADLHKRQLYLLDEIFSSLSAALAGRVGDWIRDLDASSAVVLTSHDAEQLRYLNISRHLDIEAGKISEKPAGEAFAALNAQRKGGNDSELHVQKKIPLICSEHADYYHDFNLIFKDLSFEIYAGDRVLVTGPNGSGKTTLLRIMHGDFYVGWGSGTLSFLNTLEHEMKSTLWQKVQLVAAAHFSYFPAHMKVAGVLSSRLSGSVYDYAEALPDTVMPVVHAFELNTFLPRPFASLSEGEKTRVLLARAFLKPAPLYCIDEGFMALSQRYFALACNYLNALPAEATIVIAANERLGEITGSLEFPLARWQISSGRLTTPL